MAEFDFRLPSKVPYGYVSFHGTREEFLELPVEEIAEEYARIFYRYKEAEKAALAAGPQKNSLSPAKVAAEVDAILNQDEVSDLIKRELGGVEVPDDGAPWDNKPTEPQPAKPYETPVSASEADWDFG